MGPIRILIVDDHEVVRAGLRAMLEIEPDLRVIGESGDGGRAILDAESLGPDVVIMDVRMDSMDGIAACREIKSRRPHIGVLMLTSFGSNEAVLAALVAGASGFMLKNAPRAELLRAVRAVGAGQSLLDPAITKAVTSRLVELTEQAEHPAVAALSTREREVLALVAHGATNREIAEKLVVAETTARNHVSHILEKLGMSRRSEAAAFAAQVGLT